MLVLMTAVMTLSPSFCVFADAPDGAAGIDTSVVTEQPADNQQEITVSPDAPQDVQDPEEEVSSDPAVEQTTEDTVVEQTTEEQPAAEAQEEKARRTGRSILEGGNRFSYKSDVYTDAFLPANCRPYQMKFTAGSGSSILLEWTDRKKEGRDVDGYILFRRVGAGNTYYELTRTGATQNYFYDNDSKSKNTIYYYLVVSYKKDANGGITVSPSSLSACGVITGSARVNPYAPVMTPNKVTIQQGEKVQLNLQYPGNSLSTWTRWRSDNSAIAGVSNGLVTGRQTGTTLISGRTPNGRDIRCTVTVVAPRVPGTPVLTVGDGTTESSVEVCWAAVKDATGYDVYCSSDDGQSYTCVAQGTKSCSYTVTGLKKGDTRTFYVVAQNAVNGTPLYGAQSKTLKAVAEKTVVKTVVTGVSDKITGRATTSIHFDATIKGPAGRTAIFEMYEGGKWVKKTTQRLPDTRGTASVKLCFSKHWWPYKTSKWRIRIPASTDATAYTSPTITVTGTRAYQNPKGMIQITDNISRHGLPYYYVSPVRVTQTSTRADHVEAMISRAYDYLGDPYVDCKSRQPGPGVDCSGLTMQACYAAGVDLYPSNPYRHQFPAYEYECRNIWKLSTLQKVNWSDRKRGDLIFFEKNGVIFHVAIYLGNDQMIHSWPGTVRVSSVYGWGTIAGVRRIFH